MEKALLLLLVAGLCQAAKYTRTVSYEDELVARCVGVKREKFQELLELDGLDVWSISPDGAADIRMKKDLYSELKVAYPECSILHSSVEEIVREAERQMRPKNLTAEWFEEYHPFEEIVEYYQQLSEEYGAVVELVNSIGKTVEGRDQFAVHITAAGQNGMKIYMQCQIHAREWISGATCAYLATYLLEEYEKGTERIKNLLDKVEFVFVPCVNPDGYVYTWTNDRLWRKNRRIGSNCNGVDLNRNYPDHWEWTNGSSPNECSETFRGPSASSEPETKDIINYFIQQQSPEAPVVGAFDWHSFSQLILRPYGWTYDNMPDEEQMKELGTKMSNEIFAVHGKRYTSQRAVDLYPGTGTALDWFYSDDGNPSNGDYRAASMVIELRDTGQYGFLLPPDQIIPTGEEMVPAVLAFAEELSENPLMK